MPLPIKYDQGNNTAKDPSEVGQGELVQSTGGYYRPGDDRLWKIGGVVEFGDTGSGKKIDGVELLQYDEGGSDRVVALSDGTLYGATILGSGATGTFSTIESGLGTAATSLSAAQFNDRWYLALGSKNLTVESDGTTRGMGMRSASGSLVLASSSGSTVPYVRPSSGTGIIPYAGPNNTVNSTANAYDTNATTYAFATAAKTSTATVGLVIFSFPWSGTSNTLTGRSVKIVWSLGPSGGEGISSSGAIDDVGSAADIGYDATIRIRVSEDGGLSFPNSYAFAVRDTKEFGYRTSSVPISDTFDINGLLVVEISLFNYVVTPTAVLSIYDISVGSGGEAQVTAQSGGWYYGATEYDIDSGAESTAVTSTLISVTAKASLTLTLPTAQNSNATHWRLYRTTDGGSKPSGLGQIDQIEITKTTYVDDFSKSVTVQTEPLYPLLRSVAQQDAQQSSPIFHEFLKAPQELVVLRAYEGSLVGLSSTQTRKLFYSVAGYPEAWPAINVIESFPFEEHDELLDCVSLGSLLLIAARGTMMRLSGLPRVVNAVRDSSQVEQLKGAPGCVGRYALTAFSVQGEPRAAWIAPYGIYMTNGDSSVRISDSIDWTEFDGIDKAAWVLHWDANRLVLVFSYSTTGGVNDRYQLLHMAPEHAKSGTNQPKWTGPHYGSYNALASGQVVSTHRLYAGHTSNGIIYTLDLGGLDESEAYSGTTLPLIVQIGKVYAGDAEWSALDAVLYHTDFGGGQSCTLDWTVGNDLESGGDATISQTVSLSGHKGTQLDIAQRCQWAQATITHTGNGTGALRVLEVETAKRGRRGAKRVG